MGFKKRVRRWVAPTMAEREAKVKEEERLSALRARRYDVHTKELQSQARAEQARTSIVKAQYDPWAVGGVSRAGAPKRRTTKKKKKRRKTTRQGKTITIKL